VCFFPLKVLYFHFNVSTCAYGHTASRMVLGRTPQPIDIVVFKFVIGSKIKKMIATEKQTRQLLVFNLFSISSGSETACWRSPATYPCSPWRGFWKIRSDFCCSPSEWRLNRKKWLNSAGLHGLWPVRSKWVVYFRPWFPVACQQPSSPAAREATSSLAATREAGRSSAWFDKELNLLTTGAETTAWFFFLIHTIKCTLFWDVRLWCLKWKIKWCLERRDCCLRGQTVVLVLTLDWGFYHNLFLLFVLFKCIFVVYLMHYIFAFYLA